VLAKILFNKEARNYEEAINNIDTAFSNILGLDMNLLTKLSAEDIISLIRIAKDDSTASMKYIVIAKLLKEKAEIEKLSGREISVLFYDYQKVLRLYLEGILNNKNTNLELRDYYADVNEIIKIIKDEIPQDTRFKLFRFYELSGEYDKAENELFRLRNLDYNNIEEEGKSFFRRLEKLSNTDLMKGNFSREEAAQGLAEFTKGVT